MGRPVTNPHRATAEERAQKNAEQKARHSLTSVYQLNRRARAKLILADKLEQGVTAMIENLLTIPGGIKAYQLKELNALAKSLRKDAEEVLLVRRNGAEAISDDLRSAAAQAGVPVKKGPVLSLLPEVAAQRLEQTLDRIPALNG